MGEKLKQLFDLAVDRGGLAMPVKVAMKTCITSRTAATIEDTPERIALVEAAIDELLAAQDGGASSAIPHPSAWARSAASGRIKRYFDFARERGGTTLTARLAVKTCITSQSAGTTPDTEENLAKVRAALFDLMPGVAIPNF